MFAKILYVIVLLMLICISCPIIYVVFQLVFWLLGSTFDDVTGTDTYDSWSWS